MSSPDKAISQPTKAKQRPHQAICGSLDAKREEQGRGGAAPYFTADALVACAEKRPRGRPRLFSRHRCHGRIGRLRRQPGADQAPTSRSTTSRSIAAISACLTSRRFRKQPVSASAAISDSATGAQRLDLRRALSNHLQGIFSFALLMIVLPRGLHALVAR